MFHRPSPQSAHLIHFHLLDELNRCGHFSGLMRQQSPNRVQARLIPDLLDKGWVSHSGRIALHRTGHKRLIDPTVIHLCKQIIRRDRLYQRRFRGYPIRDIAVEKEKFVIRRHFRFIALAHRLLFRSRRLRKSFQLQESQGKQYGYLVPYAVIRAAF